MKQRKLFPDYARPLAHTHGPETSKQAVQRHIASGRAVTHANIVLGLVRDTPGLTSAELATWVGVHGIDLTELRRRLTSLKNDGRIVRGEERKCRVAGTAACTWRVA